MYKVRHFAKHMCTHTDRDRRLCNHYSIWSVNAVPLGNTFRDVLQFISPCTHEIFPLIYWIVMGIAVVGLGVSIYEFLTVYHGNKCLTTFRSRKFYVLPGVFRRNARLVGAAFMAKFYLLMLLGVIMMYPAFIVPYLTVQALSFIMDLVLWALDLVTDDEFLTGKTALSYLLFIITWTFVQCVKSVFEDAIKSGDTQNLSLIKL